MVKYVQNFRWGKTYPASDCSDGTQHHTKIPSALYPPFGLHVDLQQCSNSPQSSAGGGSQRLGFVGQML